MRHRFAVYLTVAFAAATVFATSPTPANASPQTLCGINEYSVPESTSGIVTATYLEPGQSVAITGGGSIWAGVWFTGRNGPEGWFDTTAPSYYPLPGAREYSLLARANGGWQYIGQYGVVTNTGPNLVPVQLRTNDNNPGGGDGAFTATYTTCYTDGDWTRIGHANDIRTMTNAGTRLYAVTKDDRLWMRDAVRYDVNWTYIGQAAGVRALAGTDAFLYAATTDNRLLVRGFEPWNVPWAYIGHANNVTAMTAMAGKLYATTSDNQMWDRDIVHANINWRPIGRADNVRALSANGGKLYAATTDNLLLMRSPDPSAAWAYVRRAYNVTGLGALYGYLFATTSDGHLLCRVILPSEL